MSTTQSSTPLASDVHPHGSLCGVLRVGALHDALAVVRELGATGAATVRLGVPSSRADQPRDWSVVLTTERMALKPDSISFWEEVMIGVERQRPGSKFLGWRTPCAGAVPGASLPALGRRPVPTHWPASQRELVAASLLRRPVGSRRRAALPRR